MVYSLTLFHITPTLSVINIFSLGSKVVNVIAKLWLHTSINNYNRVSIMIWIGYQGYYTILMWIWFLIICNTIYVFIPYLRLQTLSLHCASCHLFHSSILALYNTILMWCVGHRMLHLDVKFFKNLVKNLYSHNPFNFHSYVPLLCSHMHSQLGISKLWESQKLYNLVCKKIPNSTLRNHLWRSTHTLNSHKRVWE